LGFREPPTRDLVTKLLNCTAEEWFSLSEELLNACLFSHRHEGQPWFHERRRRILWDLVLSGEERQSTATKILGWLFPVDGTWSSVSVLDAETAAAMCAIVPDFRSRAGVEAAMALSGKQLATLFALMELMEPRHGQSQAEPHFVDSDSVLEEARLLLGEEGDYVEALEGLISDGLIYVASNDRASIVTLTVPSREALAVLVGRQITQLGRLPVNRVASVLFEALLRPALVGFVNSVYGIGRPNPASMQRDLDRVPRERIYVPSQPSLLTRGMWGSRTFYLAADFHDDESRDAAATMVRSIDTEVVGERFRPALVLVAPSTPLPGSRFVHAVAAVSGRERSDGEFEIPSRRSELAAQELLEAKLQMREFIRARATYPELVVAGMEEVHGYALSADPDGSYLLIEYAAEEAEVRFVRERPRADWWSDPLFPVRVIDEMGLPVRSRVVHVEAGSSFDRGDLPMSVASEFRKRVREYNRSQREPIC